MLCFPQFINNVGLNNNIVGNQNFSNTHRQPLTLSLFSDRVSRPSSILASRATDRLWLRDEFVPASCSDSLFTSFFKLLGLQGDIIVIINYCQYLSMINSMWKYLFSQNPFMKNKLHHHNYYKVKINDPIGRSAHLPHTHLTLNRPYRTQPQWPYRTLAAQSL